MASSSDDDVVTLLCIDPSTIDPAAEHSETLISTTDIHNWDISTILHYQTVRIQANRRSRLSEQSSYFHGLLSGSFSESNLDLISVQWNLEIFLNILKCMFGCPVDVASNNFISLFEAALYFGVEALLLNCKDWFYKVLSSRGSWQQEVQLNDLIHIWSFLLEHSNDLVPELCVSYLARNFMWAMSSKLFVHIPYQLLSCCIMHPHLTVNSEMHLSDALQVWLNANIQQLESPSSIGDDYTDILKQIRTSLLPLWFAAGKRRSKFFSEIANESVETIFRLMDMQATGSIEILGDGSLDHLRIRITEYSKVLDLSGCPQVTSAILIFSLLPFSSSMYVTFRSINQSFQTGISKCLPPTLSFELVEEVDISKCIMLNIEVTIECFSKSFPSMRKLRASYLLNFKSVTLSKLVRKCPLISEVDLTVDITPVLPAQASVVSSNSTGLIVDSHSMNVTSHFSGPALSNITSLTLVGRSDIYDSSLQCIAQLCASLNYLNLKGCISLTDVGISNVIRCCIKLNSILVCDTSFGRNSVIALCSTDTNCSTSDFAHVGVDHSDSLAYKLKTLHMGGCKGIDERSLQKLMSQSQSLRSLCLRNTHLVDNALYSFLGSLLEMLDVSDTKISGVALAHIIRGNPTLKCLNARGCQNLIQQESSSKTVDLEDLYAELGRKCILEEIALGWSFSGISLEAMKPGIMSLRTMTVGMGGSFDENSLRLLPTTCPMLERLVLYFQVISDTSMIQIMTSLRYLQELALCYCLGDVSIASFKLPLPKLKKLRLERVTPWMTNDNLVVLTQNYANLTELSLVGCRLLNSDSLHIISYGWPGLISLRLEECGEVTANKLSSLFNCIALEDLLLRHNGQGMYRSFILDATSKMPMLRQVSLDLCDACEGVFDIPDNGNRNSLSIVKIARCKHQRSSSKNFIGATRRPPHKETLALVWNSEHLIRTVVKERL